MKIATVLGSLELEEGGVYAPFREVEGSISGSTTYSLFYRAVAIGSLSFIGFRFV
ncbi:hypothetical protein Dimus_025002 [Dionaea muscipula]